MMKLLAYLLCFVFYISCSREGRKPVITTAKDSIVEQDSSYISWENMIKDSLASLKFDTSTIDGKVKYIINQWNLTDKLGQPVWKDSLFDLNYDGYKDLVLWYFNSAGTATDKAAVYYYYPAIKSFILNEDLQLSSPSFYINKKKITSCYFGMGGGYGEQLEWINGKWQATITFQVSNLNPGEKELWEIEYPLTGKKKTLRALYREVPPEIMETD